MTSLLAHLNAGVIFRSFRVQWTKVHVPFSELMSCVLGADAKMQNPWFIWKFHSYFSRDLCSPETGPTGWPTGWLSHWGIQESFLTLFLGTISIILPCISLRSDHEHFYVCGPPAPQLPYLLWGTVSLPFFFNGITIFVELHKHFIYTD